MPNTRIDFIGQKYHRWTILGDSPDRIVGEKKIRTRIVNCLCDCGTERAVLLYTLRNGDSISCGCHRREVTGKLNFTHGQARAQKQTKEYKAWAQMIQRCFKFRDINVKNYQDRGITVCDRWKNSFESFYGDMGEATSKKHSVDRINNDLNYSCGKCEQCVRNGWEMNCRWATSRVQQGNTRRNRWLEYNGREMILADWAREFKIDRSHLGELLKKKPMEIIAAKYELKVQLDIINKKYAVS